MNLERAFTVEADENTVRDRLIAFLEKSDYKRASSQPWQLYQRGSKLGSIIGFSPKDWQVNAKLETLSVSGQTEVTIALDIDTTGQWVTEKERGFWHTELDNLEKSVLSCNI